MSEQRAHPTNNPAADPAADPVHAESPTEWGATPPPGTAAAVATGCRCPTLANSPSATEPTAAPLIAPDCALHHPQPADPTGGAGGAGAGPVSPEQPGVPAPPRPPGRGPAAAGGGERPSPSFRDSWILMVRRPFGRGAELGKSGVSAGCRSCTSV